MGESTNAAQAALQVTVICHRRGAWAWMPEELTAVWGQGQITALHSCKSLRPSFEILTSIFVPSFERALYQCFNRHKCILPWLEDSPGALSTQKCVYLVKTACGQFSGAAVLEWLTCAQEESCCWDVLEERWPCALTFPGCRNLK